MADLASESATEKTRAVETREGLVLTPKLELPPEPQRTGTLIQPDPELLGRLSGNPKIVSLQLDGSTTEKTRVASASATKEPEKDGQAKADTSISAGVFIEEQSDKSQAFAGAKKYQMSNGEQIWQLPDGRIVRIFEPTANQLAVVEIWAPRGSGQESGVLYKSDSPPFPQKSGEATTGSEKAETVPARLYAQGRRSDFFGGFLQSDGVKILSTDFNPRDLYILNQLLDHDTIDTLNKLDLPEIPIEPASTAARRILPDSTGQLYEKTELAVIRSRADLNIDTTKSEYFDHPTFDAQKREVQQFRTYRILSASQAAHYADLQEELKQKRISQDDFDNQITELRKQAVPISYTEELAAELDQQRALRELARLNPQALPNEAKFDELRSRILTARRELFIRPQNELLLPEEWGQLLDALPSTSAIEEFRVVPWTQKNFGSSGDVYMDVLMSDGRLTKYDSLNTVKNSVFLVLSHEWAHLVETRNKELLDALDAIKGMHTTTLRPYADSNRYERFAVHMGEAFLSPNAETAALLSLHSPIDTLFLSEILKEELESTSPEQRSDYHDIYMKRVEFLRTIAEPRARELLLNRIHGGNFLGFAHNFVQAIDKLIETPGGLVLAKSLLPQEEFRSRIQNLDKASVPGSWTENELRTYFAIKTFQKLYPEDLDIFFLRRTQEVEASLAPALSFADSSERSEPLYELDRLHGTLSRELEHVLDLKGLKQLLDKQTDPQKAATTLNHLLNLEARLGKPENRERLIAEYFTPQNPAWEAAARAGFQSQEPAILLRLSDQLMANIETYKSMPGASESLVRILHENNMSDLSILRTYGFGRYSSLPGLIRLATISQLLNTGQLDSNQRLVETSRTRMTLAAKEFKEWFETELESDDPKRRSRALKELEPLAKANGPTTQNLLEQLNIRSALLNAVFAANSESFMASYYLSQFSAANDNAAIGTELSKTSATEPLKQTDERAPEIVKDASKITELSKSVSITQAGSNWDLKGYERIPGFISCLRKEVDDGSVRIYGEQLERAAAIEAQIRVVSFRIGATEFRVARGSTEEEIRKAVSTHFELEKLLRKQEGRDRLAALEHFITSNDVQSKMDHILRDLPGLIGAAHSDPQMNIPALLNALAEISSLDTDKDGFNLIKGFDRRAKRELGELLIQSGFASTQPEAASEAGSSLESQVRQVISRAALLLSQGQSVDSSIKEFSEHFNTKLAASKLYFARNLPSDDALLAHLSGNQTETAARRAMESAPVLDAHSMIISIESSIRFITELRDSLKFLKDQAKFSPDKIASIESVEREITELEIALKSTDDLQRSQALDKLNEIWSLATTLERRTLDAQAKQQLEARQALLKGAAISGAAMATLAGLTILGLMAREAYKHNSRDNEPFPKRTEHVPLN